MELPETRRDISLGALLLKVTSHPGIQDITNRLQPDLMKTPTINTIDIK